MTKARPGPSFSTPAIVLGSILIAVATWRMFNTSIDLPAAPAEVTTVLPVAAIPTPPVDVAAAQIPPAEPNVLPLSQEVSPIDESGLIASQEESPDTGTPEVATPAHQALQTFYVEVEAADGARSTLSLSAADAQAARMILRNFRGDPKILNGPALESDW